MAEQKINDSDIIIDSSTATWDMGNIRGELGGTYSGIFTFRCFLTPMQSISIGKAYRGMLGEHALLAPEHEAHLCYALTQLEKRVIKGPPFWFTPVQNGELPGSIPDTNVILSVLDAAIRAQKLYNKKMLEERDTVLKRTIKIAEDKLQEDTEADNVKQ